MPIILSFKNFYYRFFLISITFFIYISINIFYFFDFMSYGLRCLSILIGIFIITLGKIYDNNYFKFELKLVLFFFIFLLIFLSFYLNDFFYFYLIFEFSVIPIFLYIIIWGTSAEKIKASVFLFFYTYFSSLVFIIYLMRVYSEFKSFDFIYLFINFFLEKNLFNLFYLLLIIMVFLVKLPVFVFHVWLPLAHVESPLIGSILLASLILKLGGYGLIRLIELYYFNFLSLNFYLIVFGIWGSIITAFVCLSQFDLKKMVAFSSVSHMSLIIGSIFSLYKIGKIGRIIIILGHGFTSSRMFLGLGVIYYRLFTRNYFLISSLILLIPSFFIWWFIFISINISLPPFIGFFRELLIFSSYLFRRNLYIAIIIFVIILTSYYRLMLFLYPSSSLELKSETYEELFVRENLIIYIHSFFLVFRVLFYWIF